MDKAKAMIALSGGVDSSVAAWLTMQEGFFCVGATMRLYEGPEAVCGSAAALEDARSIADKLGIPFHVFDMTGEFSHRVIDDFVQCYEEGLTPNPCIHCNRHMKFGAFLEQALALGCHWIVTGHYARISQDPATGRFLLRKAADNAKDQSYFLYALSQEQISHVRFPLGDMTKEQAREIAEDQGFVNARKRDSQDICFVPDGDYYSFLLRRTGKTYPAGDFLDLDGNVVGKHQGTPAYTLGQRKGLGLAMGAPVYVCGKDMDANTVVVGPNEALFHKSLRARDWFFFPFEQLTQPIRCMAKARSRMAEQPATVHPEENGFCRVEFDEPQRALTPGQAVVLYDGDLVIGGATITEVI